MSTKWWLGSGLMTDVFGSGGTNPRALKLMMVKDQTMTK